MTTSFGSASDESRRRVGDWLLPVTIALVCLIAPAFATDDTRFFNYLNNVESPQPLYYYNGYIPVLPQLASFAVKALPLALQAASYRIVPLLTMLLLYSQLRQLFSTRWPAGDARLLAFAIALTLCMIDRDLGASLTFAPWSALIAAVIYVARDRPESRRWSWLSAAGVLLAALSLPAGLLLAPVLVAQALATGLKERRPELTLASIIVVAHGLIAAGSPESVSQAIAPSTIVAMFAAGFREHKLANLIAIASSAAIVLACALVWRNGRRADYAPIWALAVVGLGSVVAYPFSARFVLYDGGFELRYTLPVFACAAVVSMLALSAIDAAERVRSMAIGITVGAAVTLAASVEYTSLRGPLELALMKYRFLQVAQEFRATCRADEAVIFEHEDTSPVILCRPGVFAPGYVSVRNVPPSIGFGSAREHELPGILVPEPLF